MQFEAALAAAWDGGRPDVFTAFDRVGKAYLQFAKTEPAYYSAMFEAGIPLEANPQLRDAGERAFAVLRTAAERLVATMPAQDPAAGPDDGAAHLGDVARDRLAVSVAAMPPGARSRCRPRICSRPRCWSICAAWAWTCPATR